MCESASRSPKTLTRHLKSAPKLKTKDMNAVVMCKRYINFVFFIFYSLCLMKIQIRYHSLFASINACAVLFRVQRYSCLGQIQTYCLNTGFKNTCWMTMFSLWKIFTKNFIHSNWNAFKINKINGWKNKSSYVYVCMWLFVCVCSINNLTVIWQMKR